MSPCFRWYPAHPHSTLAGPQMLTYIIHGCHSYNCAMVTRLVSPLSELCCPTALCPYLLRSFSMQAFPASSFTHVISAQPFPARLQRSWLNNVSNTATTSSKLVVGSTTAVQAALRGSAASALLLGPYWVVAVGE